MFNKAVQQLSNLTSFLVFTNKKFNKVVKKLLNNKTGLEVSTNNQWPKPVEYVERGRDST